MISWMKRFFKTGKIRVAVLQISSHLGIGHAQVAAGHARGKNEFFFGNVPNGSIRKVNWLKSKFEHLLQNLPTTGAVLEIFRRKMQK